MKLFHGIVLCLMLLYTSALALDAVQSYPDCALGCLTEYIPQSGCSATNTTCLCTATRLQTQLTACVVANCSVKQALVTENVTATTCAWPVRDESASLRNISIPLAVIASIFVAARLVARIPVLTGSSFKADDWMILASWALAMAFTILLAMLSYSGLGRNVWTLTPHDITKTLQLFTALEKVYIPCIWFTKISILLLYLRLFPDPKLRRNIKIGLGLCSITVFALFWACVFKCWPISFAWNYWDGEHKGKCTSEAAQGWANSFLNMFADIVVLLLPLPTIWKLNLSTEKRMAIMAMFSVGLFVTIVSMVRLKTMKYFTFSTNATWDFVQLALWSALEIYVGIICVCMPGMRALYTRIFRGRRKWEQTGDDDNSHDYNPTATNNTNQTTTSRLGENSDSGHSSRGSGSGLMKHQPILISKKHDFELSVTESESTEDLTTGKEQKENLKRFV